MVTSTRGKNVPPYVHTGQNPSCPRKKPSGSNCGPCAKCNAVDPDGRWRHAPLSLSRKTSFAEFAEIPLEIIDSACFCSRSECVLYSFKRHCRYQLQDVGLASVSGGSRLSNDAYMTLDWQLHSLLDCLRAQGITISGSVLDPTGRNRGCISHILTSMGCVVTTNDLQVGTADYNLDASSADTWLTLPKCDWIVTSFPYRRAFEMLQLCWSSWSVGCCVKLRLSFLEPTLKRRHWLRDHPPDALFVLPRATYGNCRDVMTEAWFCYFRGAYTGSQRIAVAV